MGPSPSAGTLNRYRLHWKPNIVNGQPGSSGSTGRRAHGNGSVNRSTTVEGKVLKPKRNNGMTSQWRREYENVGNRGRNSFTVAVIIRSIRSLRTILTAVFVSLSLTLASFESDVWTVTSGHLFWQAVLAVVVIVADATTAILLVLRYRLRNRRKKPGPYCQPTVGTSLSPEK